MTGSGSAAQGQRLLVATAVAHYPKAHQWDRPGLVSARQQVIDLFTGVLGYTHDSDLGLDPTETQLTEHLRTLCRHRVRPEDHLVVYIAGHGEILDDGGGRHVLLTADTDPDDVADALPTLRLADKMLLGTPVQRLLLLLDTCYSGSGGNQVAAAVLAGMEREWTSGSGLVVVTSTQPFEQAETGAFPALLSAVVQALSTAGQVPPSLDLAGVVEAMNSHPERPAHQQIGWTALGLTGTLPDFLPNPRHRPGMTDIDLHLQQAAEWDVHAQRREVEFRRRFLVRAMAAQGPAQAWWFSGRRVALTDITTWLTQATPQQTQLFPQDMPSPAAAPAAQPLSARALVVTAGPGSGKTAVLGLVSALTHPEHRPTVPIDALQLPPAAIPPIGAVDVTIYAGGLTHDQVQAGLAAAAQVRGGTIGELITALDARAAESGRPFTAIIDALDEAADPAQLITQVLRPITDHAHGVRLLLGTRPHLLKLLEPPGTPARVGVIDLDAPRWADRKALTVYTIRNLIEASPDSPYRNVRPRQARSVANAVAAAADPSFLVARITSTTLAAADTIADPADPHWRASLPRLPGDAMRKDLDTRLGPDAARARDLLRPLAYAEGQGLPWEDIWAPLASRISGHTYTNDDLHWLRRHAGSYVVEATEVGRSAYRLYHQALAEHLRATTAAAGLTETAIYQAYVDVLVARVPRTLEASRDWAHAHPYTLHHLATHAAAAGTLDALLDDVGYLVHADPATLVPALADLPAGAAGGAADTYRASYTAHYRRAPAARAQILAIDAARYGHTRLAQRLSSAVLWQPVWGTNQSTSAAVRLAMSGHTGPVKAVAAGAAGDREVIVSGGDDGTVRVWDAATGQPAGRPLAGHAAAVTAVAVGRAGDRGVTISADEDGTRRVWDAATGQPASTPLADQAGRVTAVAAGRAGGRDVIVSGAGWDVDVHDAVTGELVKSMEATSLGRVLSVTVGQAGGRDVVVLGDDHGRVRVLDAVTGDPRPPWRDPARPYIPPPSLSERVEEEETPPTPSWCGHQGPVLSVALGRARGRDLIISCDDRSVVVQDAVTGEHVSSLEPAPAWRVLSVAAGRTGDRDVLVSAGDDGAVREWDTATGQPAGQPLVGHAGPVNAVAVCRASGRNAIVSGGDDGTVRVWETAISGRTGPHADLHTSDVKQVAAGRVGERDVIVSGSDDGTVLVWDAVTGRSVARMPRSDTVRMYAVAVGRVGGRDVILASRGKLLPSRNGQGLEVFDAISGEPAGAPLWDLPSGMALCVAVGRAGGRDVIISGGDDGEVRVWDAATRAGTWLRLAGHMGPVTTLAVGRAGGRDIIVAGGEAGRVQVWDASDEANWLEAASQWVMRHPGAFGKIDSGDWIEPPVVTLPGSRATPPATPASRRSLAGHTGPVNAVAVGRAGPRGIIVSGGEDGTVRVWDAAAGQPLGEPLTGHEGRVATVAVGRAGHRDVIVSGSEDGAVSSEESGTLWVWDAATLLPVSQQQFPDAIRSLALIGERLAVTQRKDVVTLKVNPAILTAAGVPAGEDNTC